MSYPRLEKIVRSTLKKEAAKGKTTKKTTATKVWTTVERLGGPTKFGIGSGAIIMGCMHLINNEVSRQLKGSLTDHEVEYILPTKMDEDLVKLAGRVPRWIAIDDSSDAIWIYWRMARAEHWVANSRLKRKKAEQTLNAARFSHEVADYMETHGIATLGDVFKEK